MPYEIEVKLPGQIAARLAQVGVTLELVAPRHFEDNWLLDTETKRLGERAAILRVRQAGGAGSLTFKARPSDDAPPTQFKQRIEIETPVADPQATVAILEQLGYRAWFRYQKYRTVYEARLPGGERLHVMYDETPVGDFVELEGEEDAISAAVSLLGVAPADYILDSYLALQQAQCAASGQAFCDMIFGEQQ